MAGQSTSPLILKGLETLERETTSLVPRNYNGTTYIDAQADNVSNLADSIELSTGDRISSGNVLYTGHGLTVGSWYYLSQTTAGAVTDIKPTSGRLQQLFFVEDVDTILVNIEPAMDLDETSDENIIITKKTLGSAVIDFNDVDFKNNELYLTYTMTTDTTFTATNLIVGRSVMLELDGAFVPTFPAEFSQLSTSEDYDATKTNIIYTTVSGTGQVDYLISYRV